MESTFKIERKRGLGSLFSLTNSMVVSKSWSPRGYVVPFQRMATSAMPPDIVFDLDVAEGSWMKEAL